MDGVKYGIISFLKINTTKNIRKKTRVNNVYEDETKPVKPKAKQK